MPCEVYAALDKELTLAIHRDTLAHDPSVYRASYGTQKQVIQERVDAKRAVQNAEYRRNSHIRSCEVCKLDGRTGCIVSHAKH
jgi:hypothetical protein